MEDGDAPVPLGLREIDGRQDQTTLCKLCFKPAPTADWSDHDADANVRLGPLYEYTVDPECEVYCAHYFCLLFSSGLDQNGDESEGILGFLPADILREWRRGQRLKCYFCEQRYATVGCATKSCRRSYHVPCAVAKGCLLRFCDDFPTFCHEHRPGQAVPERAEGPSACGVCLKEIERDKDKLLWSPCCGGWHHFSCLDRLAQSSGYFFKCPLCNNKDEFEAEMKKFGVYVPEQDASWEMDSNAYESQLIRHNTCDAVKCLCPRGRNEDVDETQWEIILCKFCGAQGIHIGCCEIMQKIEDATWKCTSCSEIMKKMPPTVHNVYSSVKRSTERSKDTTFLQGMTFIVKGNSISFEEQGTRVTMELDDRSSFSEESEPTPTKEKSESASSDKVLSAKATGGKQKSILSYMTPSRP